jgi:hypothetical protein
VFCCQKNLPEAEAYKFNLQVLRLQNEAHWLQFRCALGNCLLKHSKLIKEVEAENDVLLEAAETKDKRQEKL